MQGTLQLQVQVSCGVGGRVVREEVGRQLYAERSFLREQCNLTGFATVQGTE